MKLHLESNLDYQRAAVESVCDPGIASWQQHGLRAELFAALAQHFGRGFSETNRRHFRLFYQDYASRQSVIRHEARDKLAPLRLHGPAK